MLLPKIGLRQNLLHRLGNLLHFCNLSVLPPLSLGEGRGEGNL